MTTKRVLIISGEASGDMHAAKLVKSIKAINPNIEFLGVGGKNMREAGVNTLIDSAQMAVVGAIEILKQFKYIYRAWKQMRQVIFKDPPDLVILVDYPEFNLQMAKAAKKKGIPVVYYISPQVWAWKKRRVKTIRKRVDKMLVILPFEKPFYQRENVPVEFVGHPLANEMHLSMSKQEAIDYFQISPQSKLIGLLPGSRKGEIERLMPTMIETANTLKQRYQNIIFLLPLASTLNDEDITLYTKNSDLDIRIIRDNRYDAIALCDAAIVTSGTATLETALLGTPLVIIYKASASTYHIVKRIIKIPYIGLCNIVADKKIVQEFIQHDANAATISSEVIKILEDKTYQENMRNDLRNVKNKLGDVEDKQIAAKAVLEFLK